MFVDHKSYFLVSGNLITIFMVKILLISLCLRLESILTIPCLFGTDRLGQAPQKEQYLDS